MSEEILQRLETILKDQSLYNPDQIRVRLDREAYSRRWKKFGPIVDNLIKMGIMLGKLEVGGVPISEIHFKFPKNDPHLNPKDFSYSFLITHKDKKFKKNKIRRTAVVTIKFDHNY